MELEIGEEEEGGADRFRGRERVFRDLLGGKARQDRSVSVRDNSRRNNR